MMMSWDSSVDQARLAQAADGFRQVLFGGSFFLGSFVRYRETYRERSSAATTAIGRKPQATTTRMIKSSIAIHFDTGKPAFIQKSNRSQACKRSLAEPEGNCGKATEAAGRRPWKYITGRSEVGTPTFLEFGTATSKIL
jgi:hypothetical protein